MKVIEIIANDIPFHFLNKVKKINNAEIYSESKEELKNTKHS